MRILYLSRDMRGYTGATYQREFLSALEARSDVKIWGPGYPDFNPQLDWVALRNGMSWDPDAIVVGHSWLADNIKVPIDPHPTLELGSVDIPKVFVLNKEYARLSDKIQFASKIRVSLLVSHHHRVEQYALPVNAQPLFLPFAVAQDRITRVAPRKEQDLTFSGILRNPSYSQSQSNFRLEVQRMLFRTLSDYPIALRKSFQGFRIKWLPHYGDVRDWVARLSKGPRLSEKDYWQMLTQSATVLNGLSPLGLVGTRYFETLASQGVPVVEESDIYKHIPGIDKFFLPIESDGKGLHEVLTWVVSNPSQVRSLARAGAHEVATHHTWDVRARDLVEAITSLT